MDTTWPPSGLTSFTLHTYAPPARAPASAAPASAAASAAAAAWLNRAASKLWNLSAILVVS